MNNKLRIFIGFLILLGIFFLPWWLSALFILGAVVYFPLYIEAVFFGFLLDLLWKPGKFLISWGAGLCFVLVLIVFWIRTKIR